MIRGRGVLEANPPTVTPPFGRESTAHATSSFVPVNRQGMLRAEAGRGATATVIMRATRERTIFVGIIPPTNGNVEIGWACMRKRGKKSGSGNHDRIGDDVLIYRVPVFGLGFSLPACPALAGSAKNQDVELDDGMKDPICMSGERGRVLRSATMSHLEDSR